MATIEVVRVTSMAELREALAVRSRVFVDEQRISVTEEIDGYDTTPAESDAVHLLARVDGVTVGAARLLVDTPLGQPVHLGRVAVLRESRRHHVGSALMGRLHDEARARGYRTVEISAQVTAIPFYERLGYGAEGPVYLEAGIDHRLMRFTL